MFRFRLFHSLGMALCLCALHWGQAHALTADVPQTQKGRHEHVAPKAKAHANTGKQAQASKAATKTSGGKNASAKAARSVHKEKHAAKSATKASHSKTAAKFSGKGTRREALAPASADLPQSGTASWIGREFHGKPVANGERHAMESFTAAHRAVAFDSILKVTDMRNGRSVLVRVNDRGPYTRGRILDVSKGTAEYLGFASRGITTVRIELAGNDKDPAQRYYIRIRPAEGPGKPGLVRGFGPFEKFDEAASLFANIYPLYPNAELMAVRKKS